MKSLLTVTSLRLPPDATQSRHSIPSVVRHSRTYVAGRSLANLIVPDYNAPPLSPTRTD